MSPPGRAKLRGNRTLLHEVLSSSNVFSSAPAGVEPAPSRSKASTRPTAHSSRGRDRTSGRAVNSRLRCHFATLECERRSREGPPPFQSCLVEERPSRASAVAARRHVLSVCQRARPLARPPGSGCWNRTNVSSFRDCCPATGRSRNAWSPASRGSGCGENRTLAERLRAACSTFELRIHSAGRARPLAR